MLIGIAIGFVLGITVAALVFFVYRNSLEVTYLNLEDAKMMNEYNVGFTMEGRELMALVQTEEEAEKIAEMYGIELVKFADGVAEYTTDRIIEEVIAEGEEKGYPKLSINYKRKMMN